MRLSPGHRKGTHSRRTPGSENSHWIRAVLTMKQSLQRNVWKEFVSVLGVGDVAVGRVCILMGEGRP